MSVGAGKGRRPCVTLACLTTAICPGCMRPVTAAMKVCLQCGATYHKDCQEPGLGCVVAGCGPRPVPRTTGYPWTWPWIGACVGAAVAVFSGLVARAARDNLRVWMPFSDASSIAARVSILLLWIGCVRDAMGGATLDRHRGTRGLLWGSSMFAVLCILPARFDPFFDHPHLVQVTCGPPLLIGLGYGVVGLFRDRYKTRALLAVLLAGALVLLLPLS